MLVVYFFCGIIIFILLLVLILIASTLKVNIEKIYLDNISYSTLKKDFCIKFQLWLFGKIKILSIKLDKHKLKKINITQEIKKINTEQLKQKIKIKEVVPILKKVKVENIHLDLKLDTENVILTTMITYLISTIISIILGRTIKNYIAEKYQYKILPLYLNKNLVKLELDCIISLKIVHIINMIYLMVKKGRVNKNERTSNRRAYDYSYE